MDVSTRINVSLREARMTPTRFGRLPVRDPHLPNDLERGRWLRPAMTARIGVVIDRHQTGQRP